MDDDGYGYMIKAFWSLEMRVSLFLGMEIEIEV